MACSWALQEEAGDLVLDQGFLDPVAAGWMPPGTSCSLPALQELLI